jgi:hypothetical protein
VQRALVVALITAAAVGASAGQAAARFNWTHRVTISGRLTDHWTVSTPGVCGTTGDGSVTLDFHNKSSIHTLVTRERGTRKWLLVGLYGSFHQTTFLPPQPAAGSLTTVDNTAHANPRPGDTCLPDDKSGCGMAELRKPRVSLGGHDAGRLRFDVFSDSFAKSGCQIGQVDRFGDVDFFGHKTPELLVKMPSPRSFFRRRVVTLSGTSHDRRSFQADPESELRTDDVTRTVTVTFTKR